MHRRELAEHLARLGGVGSGGRLVGVLDALYAGNPEVRGKLGAVSAALQPQHTDADVIDLLNREIFVPMDRRADERIQRAALRASLGVAACPHPALDALVVLGISVALVKDLMQIYGLRHSARAVWRIISHVLFSASSTAVMSTVVEFAMQAARTDSPPPSSAPPAKPWSSPAAPSRSACSPRRRSGRCPRQGDMSG